MLPDAGSLFGELEQGLAGRVADDLAGLEVDDALELAEATEV